MNITIVRILPVVTGQVAQILVKRDGKYFLVSEIDHEYVCETMIFPADSNGSVTDWMETFCRRNTSAGDTILEWMTV